MVQTCLLHCNKAKCPSLDVWYCTTPHRKMIDFFTVILKFWFCPKILSP